MKEFVSFWTNFLFTLVRSQIGLKLGLVWNSTSSPECFRLFQASQGLKPLVRLYPRPERNTLQAK